MWRVGPWQGPECGPGRIFLSKSNRIQESSNRAWPASDSHSVFFTSETELRARQIRAEALGLCHIVIVSTITACLQQLHMWCSAHLAKGIPPTYILHHRIGFYLSLHYIFTCSANAIRTQREFQNICSDQFRPVGYWWAQVRYSSSSKVSAAVSCTCLQYVREACTVFVLDILPLLVFIHEEDSKLKKEWACWPLIDTVLSHIFCSGRSDVYNVCTLNKSPSGRSNDFIIIQANKV